MKGMLVYNLGLDNIQGIVFDDSGTPIITIRKDIDLIVDEEYVEQDPEQWYDAFIDIISQINRNVPDIIIDSLTVTYSPGTFVCVDMNGNHLMNAILQCDSRHKYQAKVCEKSIKKYYDDYNIPWNYMLLPRILWLKFNKPDVYKNIFKILTPDSYLCYRLCGETAVDSYSALFMGYNPKKNTYNTKIYDDMGIDTRLLPKVSRPGECIGVIAGSVREKLNLKSDISFILSSNNLIALSKFCSKDNKSSILYDANNSNLCFTDNFFKLKRDSGLIRLPLDGQNIYLYSYIGNHEMQCIKLLDKLIKSREHTTIEYTPGSNGVLVLPYAFGQNISSNSDFKACIIGMDNNTSRENIITACYESIGYELKDKINDITRHNVKIDSIEITSNIKEEIFYHIISDITCKKVFICNAADYTARGAYYTAMNMDNSSNAEKNTIIPDEEKAVSYKYFYEFYRMVRELLKGAFKYRRKILKTLIL